MRHIYGFDTFEGFINTSKDKDGSHLSDGDYCVYDGYESQLEEILSLHEANSPISHIKKFTLLVIINFLKPQSVLWVFSFI